MALNEVLPSLASRNARKPSASNLPTYLALMEDRFTLEANGDFVLTVLQ